MRKALRKILREEKGQALPIALAMLAIGSLVVVPLLNLTETTLRAGISEERRMYEHYAANAGIMDGIREIVTDNPQLPAIGDNWTYSITDTNYRSVDVIITKIDSNNWEIAATATTGSGGSTELNCYVEKKTYLPNAITAKSVTILRDSVINGNVQWDSTLGILDDRGGIVNGEIIDSAVAWPTFNEVDAFYLDQVQGAPVYEGTLDLYLGPETLIDPYSLGPIYINGDLGIHADPDCAVRLDGIVYVNGSADIYSNVNVYMNNNTIFSPFPLSISSDASMYEYGCIVTKPNLSFNFDVDSNACIILWSIEGDINVGSTGIEVFGAAYSPQEVTVARESILTYMEHPPEMSIPPLPGSTFRIVGWESYSQ